MSKQYNNPSRGGRRAAPPSRSREEYRTSRREPARPTRTARPTRAKRSPLASFGRSLYRLVLVVSILIVVGFAAMKLFVKPPQQTPVPPAQTDQGSFQRREGVYTVLLAATDKEGERTDTMMVACYDVPNKKVGVVSVPRDSLIDRGQGKNARLVYGPGSAKERREDISRMLGIPIDYYVKVDIRGFIALVDYVGGVDFDVPCDMDYDDPAQDLHIHFAEGRQHLDGQAAMEVARFRKNNANSSLSTGGYSDVGRTGTQQQILVALAKKVLAWNNVTKVKGFVKMFNQYVETDLELNDMLWFATQAIYVDPSSDVETATLEGRGDGIFRGQTYCYELNRKTTVELVNRLINPYVQELTLQDMNLTRAERYMS